MAAAATAGPAGTSTISASPATSTVLATMQFRAQNVLVMYLGGKTTEPSFCSDYCIFSLFLEAPCPGPR